MLTFLVQLARCAALTVVAIVLAFAFAVLVAAQAHAALVCEDYAAIARAAALARASGESEESLVDRVPSIVLHLLSDGERATERDLEVARQLAIAVHRQPITARAAEQRTLQQCRQRQA